MKVKVIDEIDHIGRIMDGEFSGSPAYLWYEQAITDLHTITKNLSEFCHNRNVSNVVFADVSARLGYLALTHYYRTHYPNEKVPGRYFINPQKDNNQLCSNELEQKYPLLMQDKDKPLLLFDNCAHHGNTMNFMKSLFSQAGFDKIYTVVGFNQSLTKFDFELIDRVPIQSCCIFGEVPNNISRGASIISSTFRSSDKSSRLSRLELINILNNQYELVK